MERKKDSVDRLVVFLAKRDGIDKLVKTFQYTAKIINWYLLRTGKGELAARFKNWELSAGLSRKCFRTGRFLTGFNTVRTTAYPDAKWRLLALLGNSGEMVYFFFDHFTWMSRIGLLDSRLSSKSCYISAFGEVISYVCFILTDLIMLRKEWAAEKAHLRNLITLEKSTDSSAKQVSEKKAAIEAIRFQRIMRLLSIAANLSDIVIDLADLEPNPFVTHAITLGISGLTSAWSGWYRNWPRELV